MKLAGTPCEADQTVDLLLRQVIRPCVNSLPPNAEKLRQLCRPAEDLEYMSLVHEAESRQGRDVRQVCRTPIFQEMLSDRLN